MEEGGGGSRAWVIGSDSTEESVIYAATDCDIPHLASAARRHYGSGFNVKTNPLEVQKSIGYLPEHNPLYLEMYVREYFISKNERKRLNLYA